MDYKGLKNNKDTKSSSLLNQSRSTDNSSMKDVKGNIDTILESEEFSYNKKLDDRNLERNIKLNSVLNSESNYFKEEKHKKILAKENFLYPSCNKNKSKEVKVNKSELPIELIKNTDFCPPCLQSQAVWALPRGVYFRSSLWEKPCCVYSMTTSLLYL